MHYDCNEQRRKTHLNYKKVMKRDKNIENIANRNLEGLQNNEFHEKLMSACDKRSEKDNIVAKKNKLKALYSAISIVVILAVLIPCGIYLRGKDCVKDDSSENKYCYDDELAVSADLDDVNAVLSGYLIKPDCITNISLVKDSKSGDELYFIVEMQDKGFTTCRIDLVVNSDYDYIEKVTDEKVESNGLDIDCRRITNFEAEYGVYTHTVYGETQIGDVKVYFNVYDTFTEGEDDGFVEFVETIFIIN